MKNFTYTFFLISILLSCATKKTQITDNQKMQIQYADSIKGYSFTRTTKKINSANLLFLKQFKDTIEIYLNDKKVDSFFKNDYHYENGEEYIIHDEAPNIEIRQIPLNRITKSVITILLKPSKAKVSFELRKGYNNYLVSHYNEYWYFTGLKSTIK
jgi:hypothetical protein